MKKKNNSILTILLLLSSIICAIGVSSLIFEKADDILFELNDYELYTDYEINRGYRYNTIAGPFNDLLGTEEADIYTTSTFGEGHLPKGSYVVISDGYAFYPEVWVSESYRAEHSEELVTANEKYYLDNEFWDTYSYVCFTLICDGGEFSKENFEEALKIYVPVN